MKLENISLPSNRMITFYIGENAADNDNVVKSGNDNDLWFHAMDYPSSHVLAIMPENYTKKEKSYIIKIGSQLCKQHTSKLQKEKHVAITYTRKKHVRLTNIPGTVLIDQSNTIIIQ